MRLTAFVTCTESIQPGSPSEIHLDNEVAYGEVDVFMPDVYFGKIDRQKYGFPKNTNQPKQLGITGGKKEQLRKQKCRTKALMDENKVNKI